MEKRKVRYFGQNLYEVRTGDSLATFKYYCFAKEEDADHFIKTGEIRNQHLFTVNQLYALYSL